MIQDNPYKLAGRIALITGASRGIGAAVAKRYAAEGAQVILIARTVGGLEEVDDAIRAAGHAPATLVPSDLKLPQMLDQLGAIIYERFGKLDILVGNAATLGALTPLTHADPKMWDEVMQVNLTANWRLLRTMHPLLAASDAGRALFVTSGAARAAFPYWGAYGISKAGLEMLVRTYAAEYAKTSIRANLIDPGVVDTVMRREAFPGERPGQNPAPESITDLFVTLARPDFTETGKLYHAEP
jgi:NAD(P)-dependent dehydrogenase (short-subunit alcohol dehydrogenase family)